METSTILFAFGLTIFAGLSTGIGSLLALLTKKTNPRFLSFALGFSAGFMIYVSFIEIFSESRRMLIGEIGSTQGNLITVVAFFAGITLIAVIDRLVPSVENPHEARRIEDMQNGSSALACDRYKLMRVGFMSALAITIHNFPEGLATFATALQSHKLGIAIAIAIAIHNIPEGIAVAIPIYCATGSRRKAFTWSLLSGLAEPLGALIGFAIFASFINDVMLGVLYAMVAGIMVFISLDELLPTAREYGSPHLAVYGLISGMAVMALSLLLLI
jgi:zinc transporter, ZIP family